MHRVILLLDLHNLEKLMKKLEYTKLGDRNLDTTPQFPDTTPQSNAHDYVRGKRAGYAYPRFHAILKPSNREGFLLYLHVDQQQHYSYGEGPDVNEEAVRIQSTYKNHRRIPNSLGRRFVKGGHERKSKRWLDERDAYFESEDES